MPSPATTGRCGSLAHEGFWDHEVEALDLLRVVQGKAFNPEPGEGDPALEESQGFEVLRTLEDKLRLEPDSITKDSLLGLMTDLHRGLHKAHLNGFIHGNLKPSNILITENESNPLQAWIAEFGLYRFGCFKSRGEDGNDESELPTLTLNAQQSHEMGAASGQRKPGWG